MNKEIAKINEWRQTVKAYLDKRIPAEDWQQIVDTIQWAPTSFGSEPYSVLVIEHANQDLRKALQKAMWGQGTVVEADKLVVFLSLKGSAIDEKFLVDRQMRALTKIKGKTPEEAKPLAEKSAKDVLAHMKTNEADLGSWARMQAYIALGMALSAASILGIGTTSMEGFDRKEIEKILKDRQLLDDRHQVAVVVGFGYVAGPTAYAHMGTGARVRVPTGEKFKTV